MKAGNMNDEKRGIEQMQRTVEAAIDGGFPVKVISLSTTPNTGARGRKKKEGVARDDKGRIRSSQYESPEQRAQARAARKAARKLEEQRLAEDAAKIGRWNRMRVVITGLAADPRLGTQLGRLFLLGGAVPVNAMQFEAGRRYATLLASYDSVVLDASRTARAVDPNTAGGKALRQEPDPELVERICISIAECRGVLVEAQEDVVAALRQNLLDAGHSWRQATSVYSKSIVLEATQALARGEEISMPETLRAGVYGLNALVKHWKLDQVAPEKIRGFGDKAVFDTEGGRVREFVIVRETDAWFDDRHGPRR